MKEVFAGIYTHFEADPLAASVTGMYNTKAPPNVTFPYIVFSLLGITPDIDSTQQWETCLIQFNIFSKTSSSEEICDIYNLLKGDPVAGEGYDYFELLVDDYDTVILERESALLRRVENWWQYNVTYRLMMVKTGVAATEKFCGNFYNLLSIY